MVKQSFYFYFISFSNSFFFHFTDQNHYLFLRANGIPLVIDVLSNVINQENKSMRRSLSGLLGNIAESGKKIFLFCFKK